MADSKRHSELEFVGANRSINNSNSAELAVLRHKYLVVAFGAPI